MIKPCLGVQSLRLFQLDLIDVDSYNPDTSLTDDAAHGGADSTTNVDHRHTLLQLQLGNHQPLMPDLGLLQTLMRREGREVQGLAPAPHHEPATKVVIVFHCFRVIVPARATGLQHRPVEPAVEVLHSTCDARSPVRYLSVLLTVCTAAFRGVFPWLHKEPSRQVNSSRLCWEMRNFSFLLGFSDGNGLKRSLCLYFAGDTSIVK